MHSNKPTKTTELSNLQFALLLTLPVLLFLLVIMAYPMGYAIWLSLHDVQFLFGKMRSQFVGLDNFYEVLKSDEFWHATFVSIRFTFEVVVLTLAAGLGLAMVMNSVKRMSNILRTLIMMPWAVSLYGTGVMWFYLARGQSGVATSLSFMFGGDEPINFISQRWVIEVLALGAAWNMAPLVAFFLLANLKTIPKSLYGLASIDRFNTLQTFIHVTLPPLRFTLFVFTCICTVLSLKMFDFVYMLSRGGPGDTSTVLPFLLYDISFKQLQLGYGSAMSFFLLFLIVGSTLLLYAVWGRKEERA
ncbi:putative ABC-type sugar transport systems,permease component [Vibrio nigripulchritudo SFn27]|uniref:Putative ABC-type sugar transport systems, permease component n=1 Tax=Vibrio nigripulchritudo TaxID=28173 RepID=U4K8Y0_9VIBR|nr:sugar ABC transporter permease [Vibrio nigripulchritudo]CCN73589.1 putative ABC-type sugar transport systems,permease component [Vibrio nigripulchritudo SFn118]CCN84001.1 putative ABC-type sugar transport systems,permease component [Vibrio nigripulchritudo BLFn1]CCN89329.1 putative ABC-type sugar transport systems,permease component [Vibrio nigripulchritudo SFn27]CCN93016.1 putative ABC-type sugar transport systems,permease component [Vibrio nigripulchritudo ENn2]CCO40453.1 putative ABC-typ